MSETLFPRVSVRHVPRRGRHPPKPPTSPGVYVLLHTSTSKPKEVRPFPGVKPKRMGLVLVCSSTGGSICGLDLYFNCDFTPICRLPVPPPPHSLFLVLKFTVVSGLPYPLTKSFSYDQCVGYSPIYHTTTYPPTHLPTYSPSPFFTSSPLPPYLPIYHPTSYSLIYLPTSLPTFPPFFNPTYSLPTYLSAYYLLPTS